MKRSIILLPLMLLMGAAAATQPSPKAKHEGMLYPVVRVRFGQTGGSGTVVYCQKNGSKFETFVLTNHHVIEGAISIQGRWSGLLGKSRKVEELATVTVEVFRYADLSRRVGREAIAADIVAYSKAEDLALLRLRSEHEIKHVAKLLPRGQRVHLFETVYAVGCSLGHPPISTRGEITSLNDEIENRSFWMSSASIIFGSSGGAVYKAGTFEFLGIPSRVPVTGWGSTPVSHMGLFIPMPRIYKWLEGELLTFVYDASTTPAECEVLRKARREETKGGK